MGKRGTHVAREAADVVLKDDAFNTIVTAVEQGRAIFDNIRRFILFLLSGNMAEIMIVGFALVAGMPLPILPLQILYLNMIGDAFPALALGVGRGDSSVMDRPPRSSSEAIITRRHWTEIGIYGVLVAAAVIGALYVALFRLDVPVTRAVSISFLTVSFARLLHAFNMRDWGSGIIFNTVTRNPFVWGALALCTVLLLAAVYVPPLAEILSLEPLQAREWALVAGMSMAPLIPIQILKSRPISRLLNISSV